MTVIIVDDEQRSHEVLRSLLAAHHPDVRILASGYNVQEGLALLQAHRPDVVFLDVQMPDGQGFDLLAPFHPPHFNVIFITAHQHYAISAFECSALDFLLKPIGKEALAKALEKAHRRVEEQERLQQYEILREMLDQKRPSRISIPTQEGIIFQPVRDIIRLEANQNYTEITLLNDPRKILVSTNLGTYENVLQKYHEFMRVHRSHLVNLTHVERYVKAEGGYLLMQDASQVSIAGNRKDAVLKRLQEL